VDIFNEEILKPFFIASSLSFEINLVFLDGAARLIEPNKNKNINVITINSMYFNSEFR
jgi:hypothetical protein